MSAAEQKSQNYTQRINWRKGLVLRVFHCITPKVFRNDRDRGAT